ncbi:MAG: CBS domain-containing protein [Gammaproteobacteria bacterium]|nr:CBS domain-containing protein [Gammaproteobacteria bacterium]MDH5801453.1 CBS domain-containing protein [Gammaproteobacteria bacterium]
MSLVNKLLEGKELWNVSPNDTVFEAIRLMDEKGTGALMVVDAGKLVGIISERDYARKVILKDKSSKNTLVKEIMTSRVVVANPDQAANEILAVMHHNHIRHLPVKDKDKLLGMVSMEDVVSDIIHDQKDKIKELEHYVTWEEAY